MDVEARGAGLGDYAVTVAGFKGAARSFEYGELGLKGWGRSESYGYGLG
jgi:hypothetical protein